MAVNFGPGGSGLPYDLVSKKKKPLFSGGGTRPDVGPYSAPANPNVQGGADSPQGAWRSAPAFDYQSAISGNPDLMAARAAGSAGRISSDVERGAAWKQALIGGGYDDFASQMGGLEGFSDDARVRLQQSLGDPELMNMIKQRNDAGLSIRSGIERGATREMEAARNRLGARGIFSSGALAQAAARTGERRLEADTQARGDILRAILGADKSYQQSESERMQRESDALRDARDYAQRQGQAYETSNPGYYEPPPPPQADPTRPDPMAIRFGALAPQYPGAPGLIPTAQQAQNAKNKKKMSGSYSYFGH